MNTKCTSLSIGMSMMLSILLIPIAIAVLALPAVDAADAADAADADIVSVEANVTFSEGIAHANGKPNLNANQEEELHHLLFHFQSNAAKERFYKRLRHFQMHNSHSNRRLDFSQSQSEMQRPPSSDASFSTSTSTSTHRAYKYPHTPSLAVSVTKDQLRYLQSQMALGTDTSSDVSMSTSSLLGEQTQNPHDITKIEYESHTFTLFVDRSMNSTTAKKQQLRQRRWQQQQQQERQLQQSSNIRQEEILPYGVQAVQGTSTLIPFSGASLDNSNSNNANANTNANRCQNPNAFKVCVIDDGLLVSHHDIPYNFDTTTDPSNTNNEIRGRSFVRQDWWNPSSASHGTHVAGTIIAEGENGKGIRGILPQADDGICLLIAQVFGSSGSQLSSVITQGVEWCADQGARVINMSLGSQGGITASDQAVYEDVIRNRGIMIVAAAGNFGTSTFAYPASLPDVISVAAVNEQEQRADFSQFNSQVDLAAPGVNVLSTTSSNGLLVHVPNEETPVLMQFVLMQYSPVPSERITQGRWGIADCQAGIDVCDRETNENKFCIIERGTNFFSEKALNCQQAGGIGAIIYNNQPGIFSGSLSPEANALNIRIPVFTIERDDALFLLSRLQIENNSENAVDETTMTTISLQGSQAAYAFWSGTSMATPHVAGVAAKIWAVRPQCTNQQIRTAMEATALDLGAPNRDDEYGHGLVQAEAAYLYLLRTFDFPCGDQNVGSFVSAPQPEEPICQANFETCISNDECCSGRCVLFSIGSSKVCRAAPKVTKNKLGGSSSGGAAGGGGRRRRLGRVLRGSTNVEKERDLALVELEDENENDNDESMLSLPSTTSSSLLTAERSTFKDIHAPFRRRPHHGSVHPQFGSSSNRDALETNIMI